MTNEQSYPGSEAEPRLIRLDSIDDCMQSPPADDEVVRIELNGAQLRELVGGMFAPAQGSWMPIETAPKDTNVLLCWRYGGIWEMASGWAGSTKGGWLHGQATLWMPMPAPPSAVRSTNCGSGK